MQAVQSPDHGGAPRGAPRSTITLKFRVNGEARVLELEPRRTLLDALRHDMGLCGAKQGCGMGNCGACTVLLNGEAVYACLVLAAECEGASVETVEADDELMQALRRAFIEHDAFQCGYCTPGQLMSLKALFRANPAPSEGEILTAVSGNLCRCGAYRHILEAAGAVAKRGGGDG